MKYDRPHPGADAPGRSPSGERGLKYVRDRHVRGVTMSLPIRGAWIEILSILTVSLYGFCRSPSGERGLKLEVEFRPFQER